MSFLPLNGSPCDLPLDIILVTGEAYCDHPSFGHAIVSRLVQSQGLSIGIISQPQSDSDYRAFGEPKYGFFISGGVVDSMVNNYTVAKLKRTVDVYSEGGVFGKRPDRCVNVYSRALKRLFPTKGVVIGGIEASLRRFAHYDYWADKVLPSILVDSGADLLIYGMGEVPIVELCDQLKMGHQLTKIRDIEGTCYLDSFDNLSAKLKKGMEEYSVQFCPSYEDIYKDKKAYVKAFNIQSKNNDHIQGKILLQKHGDNYLVQNIPQRACTEKELDHVYALPYERTYHPSYVGGVPAIEEVKFSITSHRGCFGSCNYCALTYHQGRIIQKRSKDNIVEEAKAFTQDKDFKGYIHDVGGPTANFRNTACKSQQKVGVCAGKPCIGYKPCGNLEVSHTEYLEILRELRDIDGVKKVFIRSGIRYDYLMKDTSDEFFYELIKHHVSGQLKVAPEHVVDEVLKKMNKPSFEVYKEFKRKFDDVNLKLGKKQFLVPYLISSHPGCQLKDAVKVAEYLKSINYMPEQVQDFYPTPSTKSTCMYYTGLDPDTMQEVYVPRDKEEKRMQRALLQYRKKTNYDIVKQALTLAGRTDLIGFDPKCLIKPTKEDLMAGNAQVASSTNNRASGKITTASRVTNSSKADSRTGDSRHYTKSSTDNRTASSAKSSSRIDGKSAQKSYSNSNSYAKTRQKSYVNDTNDTAPSRYSSDDNRNSYGDNTRDNNRTSRNSGSDSYSDNTHGSGSDSRKSSSSTSKLSHGSSYGNSNTRSNGSDSNSNSYGDKNSRNSSGNSYSDRNPRTNNTRNGNGSRSGGKPSNKR